MVSVKILSSLILLLLSALVFSAGISFSFSLVNAPPQIEEMNIRPLHPPPGTITFTGNATYSDLELADGTMNFTWYVGATPVASGGYFTSVSSGSVITALPYTGTFAGGETVLLCVVASDGTTAPVSRCVSTRVTSPHDHHEECSITVSASGGSCANAPLSLSFTREGDTGAFQLFVLYPDGVAESIYIRSNQGDYQFVPNMSGNYYFAVTDSGSCDGSGTSVPVGEITPVVYLPICSFIEMPGGFRNASDQPIVVSIMDNHGVEQEGTINISWTSGGRNQSVQQQGTRILFMPQSDGKHHASVIAGACTGSLDFTPNVCIGPNITKNETVVVYTLENKTFYVWLRTEEAKGACSRTSCSMSADCCEGYCLAGACTIPQRSELTIFPIKAGCYGIIGACGAGDTFCEILCNLVWILIFAFSAAAAYTRRKVAKEALALFFIPIIFAMLIYPAVGLAISLLALPAAYYLQKK